MEPHKTVWSQISTVVKSETFLEKMFLLIMSGLIVPSIVLVVSKSVEDRQKRVEAERVLLTSSVEVKRSFWEEISRTILTFETIALDVSWFGGDAQNQELYDAAFSEYSSRITSLIIELRILESRAGALLSRDVAEKLNNFQWNVLLRQDLDMVTLHREAATQDQWRQLHTKNLEALAEANQLISAIAIDLGIAITP